MLCSPFVEPVVSFLQRPRVRLWTTTRPNLPMPKRHTTIGLRVSVRFCVCEIAVHSVSTSPEDCAFVDHEGLNDRSTSTELTLRRHNFRGDVIRRDGHTCVVSQVDTCDAVHLIPRSKGDEVRFVVSSYNYLMMSVFQYIARVIELRSGVPGDNIGIDDTRNGMLLKKELHSKLGRGEVAFIKLYQGAKLWSFIYRHSFNQS